jgi:hypothetical protein
MSLLLDEVPQKIMPWDTIELTNKCVNYEIKIGNWK